MHENAAPDPQHGGGADGGESLEEHGHAEHQSAAERPQERDGVFGKRDAGIVGLHDQANRSVDGKRDEDADPGQNCCLRVDAGVGNGRERQRHDLGG
ncbi:hypothetical protein D3C71_1946480 [compost metagenome]